MVRLVVVIVPRDMAQYADPLVLYLRIEKCIENEMRRVSMYRESGDSAEFYLARGREQAFRAVASAIVGIEDGLKRFEEND